SGTSTRTTQNMRRDACSKGPAGLWLTPAMTDKTSDSFASLFEAETQGLSQNSAKKARLPALGERVKAEVVRLGKAAVFVELLAEGGFGKRAHAFLNNDDARGPDGQVTLKAGDVLEAVVVEVNGNELRLGRGMGKPQGADELERAYQAGVAVDGKVSG